MLKNRNVKDHYGKVQKEITIIEIAEMAGVSQATVGRVIGGYGSVSQATREKVEKIIKDVGYMPNAIAQSMKRKIQIRSEWFWAVLETPFLERSCRVLRASA